jgi:DHA1 family bicyclomycin/chloramphenicol resistance-like MFS transporter
MLVSGLAPVLAPLVGGQLLHVTNWRGIFIALALIGAVLFVDAWWKLGETLPLERRHGGGLPATLRVFASLLRDHAFMGYALTAALIFSAMATYISGSPFVLQDIYGVSPQLFSVLFAVNAGGIIVASQTSRALVTRFGPWRLLIAGVTIGAVGAAGVFVSVVGGLGLGGLLPSLFVMVSATGMVQPNAAALALADHPRTAGSASALVGLTQLTIGALAVPLAGVGGSDTALPMALVIAGLTSGAVVCLAGLAARRRGTMHA